MTTASIFVSSVQKQLAEKRRAIKAHIEGDPLLRRFFTVFLFEDLPAADIRADAVPTIPNKPRSGRQRYRLTPEGQALRSRQP